MLEHLRHARGSYNSMAVVSGGAGWMRLIPYLRLAEWHDTPDSGACGLIFYPSGRICIGCEPAQPVLRIPGWVSTGLGTNSMTF